MARTKQATPLRREPSSEYTDKFDRTPRSREVSATHEMADKLNGKANGQVSAGTRAPSTETKTKTSVAKKDAGIVTLIIDVAGIYASL
jgi:UDP-galactose transporter B1